MEKLINPFERVTGSDKLTSPFMILVVFVLSVIIAFIIGKTGLMAGIGLLALPFGLIYMYLLFKQPILGLWSAISLGFLLLGLGRYMKDVQVGLAMDGILVLTYIALIFNRFYKKVDWSPAKKDATVLAAIWFGYSVFQFFNPEVQSRAAWIAGFRGISLYMMLIIPLVLMFIDNRKKIEIFLFIWGAFSLLATLKGIIQNTLGVDPYEKAWLDAGGAVTHVLFGKLRIFSFLSDAGQFGANQGYSGVVFLILGITDKNIKKRLFFLSVGMLGIYGMFLSGTRGAISVPLAGLMLYSFLRKNKVILGTGLGALILVFIFFKYTTIGQDNQQIRRMRSAFDPNDASLQVRLENQKLLRVYLATRPIGGGIGHAGVKAQRYLPNAFLSNVATDSWYVLIWAEQGIIGLIIHLGILFYVIIKTSWLVMFKIKNQMLKFRISALASGMMGIMVASYGNAVLGTMPTGLLIYTSIAIMLNAKQFDDPDDQPETGLAVQNK